MHHHGTVTYSQAIVSHRTSSPMHRPWGWHQIGATGRISQKMAEENIQRTFTGLLAGLQLPEVGQVPTPVLVVTAGPWALQTSRLTKNSLDS